MAKDKTFQEISYFSDFEAKVGLFNARLWNNTKVYLIAYLNALIHGLLRAVRQTFGNLDQYKNEWPCLISFHIGDLLRSKCHSKEEEIIQRY